MEGRDWVFVTLDCCCLLCISDWATHARRVDGALNIAPVLPVYRWVYVFGRLCVACCVLGVLAFRRLGVGYLGVWHLGVGHLGDWVLGIGCWTLGVWVLGVGVLPFGCWRWVLGFWVFGCCAFGCWVFGYWVLGVGSDGPVGA